MIKTVLSLSAVLLILILGEAELHSQNDYVQGMENFPDIDITHYILQAEFQKGSTQVKAHATVEFQFLQAATDKVTFELDRRAKVFAVYDKNGIPLKFRQPNNSDSITIHFSNPIGIHTQTQVEMEYICDFPPLKKSESPDLSNKSRDPYFFLRKWYPINDYFCDSAPADFFFTAPYEYDVLTSGQQVSSELDGGKRISRWESFGSSNCYFVFAGPFERFVFDDHRPRIEIHMDRREPAAAEAAHKKAREILHYYKNLLCPYPFPVLYLVTVETKMDPVGLNGLTFLDYEQFVHKYIYSYMTWIHELSHHWFGGILQARSPEDYCLMIEGPAEYFTRLYIRATKGESRFRSDLKVQRMTVLAGNGTIPVTQYHTLEKGGESLYARGSYIFHMLRFILEDEKFFTTIKALLQDFNKASAGITDLLTYAERAYGEPLDWFFDQWVYGTDIPEYKLDFEVHPSGRGTYTVTGFIRQKPAHFKMPVEVVAVEENKRQSEKVFIDRPRTPFRLEVGFKPAGVLLDPEYNILRWDDDIRVWLFTSRGRRLARQKDDLEAERLLNDALKINPACSWAALERASLAELQKDYKMALKFYLQALAGDMDFLITPWPQEQMEQVLYLSIGYCYDILGRRKDAVTWYNKTIALGRDPRFTFYFDKAVEYLKNPARKK